MALALLLAACGGGKSEEEAVADANRLLPDVLPAAAASPLLGVQLPKGAEPQASAEPDTETFSVAPPVTLSEINAFYRRAMDDKPFGDFAWCGSEVDETAKAVTRFWRRSGTDVYRTVVVRQVTVTEPTLIVVSQRTGAVPTICPSP